jgi:hypothetical protein
MNELKNDLIPMLSNIWNSFINSFCKVGLLCFDNEPNWLGYIVLFFFFLFLLAIIVSIFER